MRRSVPESATADAADDPPSTESAAPAGIARRTVAYLVDAGVLGLPFLALTRGWSLGRRVLALLGVATAYHVVLEGATGLTPGKRLVGVAVVRADGGPVGYRAAATRTVWRAVDWLPVGYALGLAAMVVTDRHRRLGDLAAGTVVVRRRSGEASVDSRGGDVGENEDGR